MTIYDDSSSGICSSLGEALGRIGNLSLHTKHFVRLALPEIWTFSPLDLEELDLHAITDLDQDCIGDFQGPSLLSQVFFAL